MKEKTQIHINKFLTSIIVCSFLSIILIMTISFKLKPLLYDIARFEAEKIESTIVNNSINEVIDKKFDTTDLFTTIKNKNDEIQVTDFNTVKVNRLLNLITMKVQTDLKLLEKGAFEDLGINGIAWSIDKKYLNKGIVLGVPIGIATNIPILSEIGPKVPIKIHYLGDVSSSIYTKITEYGINSALVEVGVNIELNVKILLPFSTKKVNIKSQIPLSIKIIQGKIPNYYGDSMINNSHLYSLPID